MPINVICSTSQNIQNKIDTSPFIQKSDIGTDFIDKNIEQDIDMKTLPNFVDSQDVAIKS